MSRTCSVCLAWGPKQVDGVGARDAFTDTEDIEFVVGSKQYAMSFAKQIMEKEGE